VGHRELLDDKHTGEIGDNGTKPGRKYGVPGETPCEGGELLQLVTRPST